MVAGAAGATDGRGGCGGSGRGGRLLVEEVRGGRAEGGGEGVEGGGLQPLVRLLLLAGVLNCHCLQRCSFED